LSLILLFTFVLFGSFAFAMTTYATAFVDYVLHFVSLSFGAYGSQSSEAFVMALPEAAKPLADELIGGATNAWGSYDAFKSGLEGAAAALDEATLTAVYAAGEPGRQFWLASRLDHLLLGMVDCLLAICGTVLSTNFARSYGA
jgi:hypothetical protein